MDKDETRIVRPWGCRGSRYALDATGIFYSRLAWIAAVLAVVSVPLRGFGLLPAAVWLGLFLSAIALTAGFTWTATRHGRRLPDL